MPRKRSVSVPINGLLQFLTRKDQHPSQTGLDAGPDNEDGRQKGRERAEDIKADCHPSGDHLCKLERWSDGEPCVSSHRRRIYWGNVPLSAGVLVDHIEEVLQKPPFRSESSDRGDSSKGRLYCRQDWRHRQRLKDGNHKRSVKRPRLKNQTGKAAIGGTDLHPLQLPRTPKVSDTECEVNQPDEGRRKECLRKDGEDHHERAADTGEHARRLRYQT
jgi:hypothetical protein